MRQWAQEGVRLRIQRPLSLERRVQGSRRECTRDVHSESRNVLSRKMKWSSGSAKLGNLESTAAMLLSLRHSESKLNGTKPQEGPP